MSHPLKAIEYISKGNLKEKKELLALFIKETTQRLKILQQQTEKNNWKEVKKTAHTFKSTFLYLNMPTALQLIQTIEVTAGQNPTTTKVQVDELNELCIKTIELFKKELARLSK